MNNLKKILKDNENRNIICVFNKKYFSNFNKFPLMSYFIHKKNIEEFPDTLIVYAIKNINHINAYEENSKLKNDKIFLNNLTQIHRNSIEIPCNSITMRIRNMEMKDIHNMLEEHCMDIERSMFFGEYSKKTSKNGFPKRRMRGFLNDKYIKKEKLDKNFTIEDFEKLIGMKKLYLFVNEKIYIHLKNIGIIKERIFGTLVDSYCINKNIKIVYNPILDNYKNSLMVGLDLDNIYYCYLKNRNFVYNSNVQSPELDYRIDSILTECTIKNETPGNCIIGEIN